LTDQLLDSTNYQNTKPVKSSILPILRIRRVFSLAAAGLALCAVAKSFAADRTWAAGTGSTDFNSGANYSPTGVIAGTDNLFFNTPANAGLSLTAGLSINSLIVNSGASGFTLGGNPLTVNNGGITVASSTTATIDARISSNGAASQLTFSVGDGALLRANGVVTPISRSFHKTGAGVLYLGQGMGTNSENFLRTGASINIDEGTLEVGDSAQFQPGTGFVGTLMVNIGTETTRATLKGGGTFEGVSSKPIVVKTYGSSRSFLEPAGDGTLAIQNLDVTSGGTFKFDLGTDLILGSGTLTGSTLAGGMVLDLAGGVSNVLYTLFDYNTLSGVDISDFTISNGGYVVDFWDISGGKVKVQFSAIPEPSYLGLILLLGLVWIIKRKSCAPLVG